MAGSTSIWVSAEAKTDPRQIFNLRLLYLAVTVALAGSFYGFNQGNIGGILTLPTFKQSFGFNGLSAAELSARKGTVAAMLPASVRKTLATFDTKYLLTPIPRLPSVLSSPGPPLTHSAANGPSSSGVSYFSLVLPCIWFPSMM